MFSHLNVSRGHTKGEYEDRTGDKACKQGIHPGFGTKGRCHDKSKQGISGPTKKGFLSSKMFLKVTPRRRRSKKLVA